MRLYGDRFGVIKLPFPPPNEQRAIAQHIRAETVEAEHALDCVNREIAAIREYRIRLISDVVTGKLDVHEAAARLPEEPTDTGPLEEIEPLEGSDNAELEPALEEVDA
jgi:type I restriction enzyme, S subunit